MVVNLICYSSPGDWYSDQQSSVCADQVTNGWTGWWVDGWMKNISLQIHSDHIDLDGYLPIHLCSLDKEKSRCWRFNNISSEW
jgi:hypothetical protein